MHNEDRPINFTGDNGDSLTESKNRQEIADEANKKDKPINQEPDKLKKIQESADTAQESGKSLEQLQSDTSQDFLKSEAQRRELFATVVYSSLGIVFLLYLVLVCWVFRNMDNESHNVWHIATILALPATTILFLLIKVLAKSPNDSKDDRQASTPAGEALEKSGELAEKCLDMLKTLLNKK